MTRRWWKSAAWPRAEERRERGSMLRHDRRWRAEDDRERHGRADHRRGDADLRRHQVQRRRLGRDPDHPRPGRACSSRSTATTRRSRPSSRSRTSAPPARVDRHRVILPISGVHRGIVAALRYARALSDDVTAVYVSTDAGGRRQGAEEVGPVGRRRAAGGARARPTGCWSSRSLDYIKEVAARRQPNEVITIVVPQFVPEAHLAQPAALADGGDAAPGAAVRARDRDHERAVPGRRRGGLADVRDRVRHRRRVRTRRVGARDAAEPSRSRRDRDRPHRVVLLAPRPRVARPHDRGRGDGGGRARARGNRAGRRARLRDQLGRRQRRRRRTSRARSTTSRASSPATTTRAGGRCTRR